MIPQGNYHARAIDWKFGRSSKGTECLAVQFEISDGEYAGEVRTWWGYFTEKTAERTIQSLRYCGWRGNDLTDLSGMGTNMVQIVIQPDEYEGKVRDRIAFVNSLRGLSLADPMDDKSLRMFAAKMKGLAATIPAVPSQANAATQTPSTASNKGAWGDGSPVPGYDDNDNPF